MCDRPSVLLVRKLLRADAFAFSADSSAGCSLCLLPTAHATNDAGAQSRPVRWSPACCQSSVQQELLAHSLVGCGGEGGCPRVLLIRNWCVRMCLLFPTASSAGCTVCLLPNAQATNDAGAKSRPVRFAWAAAARVSCLSRTGACRCVCFFGGKFSVRQTMLAHSLVGRGGCPRVLLIENRCVQMRLLFR